MKVYDAKGVTLYHSHSIFALMSMPADSVDSIVTDPPYGLRFMGKKWDYDVPSVQLWAEALRVLKPGGHLLSFAGSRTYHRMAVNIEDAGFEIRDQIMWVYGSGFPKSLDISKAIDKRGGAQVAWFGPWFRQWREKNDITQKEVAALFPSKTGGLTGCVANWELGFNMPTPEQFNAILDKFDLPFSSIEEAEREVMGSKITNLTPYQNIGDENVSGEVDISAPASAPAKQWDGWGTALKPAHEPIVVARKPIDGTVAENVLKHGIGGINIDGGRIGNGDDKSEHWGAIDKTECNLYEGGIKNRAPVDNSKGRFPANIIFDPEAGAMLDRQSGSLTSGTMKAGTLREAQDEPGSVCYGTYGGNATSIDISGDSGGASRFFYCAKASKADRDEGLEGMEKKTAGECTGRQDNTAGLNSPRAGAGRTAGGRNHHPTVKPTTLMQYLVRLVTPPGGTVADPFMGSGSTGKAAVREGFKFVGCEREAEYIPISLARINAPAQVELI